MKRIKKVNKNFENIKIFFVAFIAFLAANYFYNNIITKSTANSIKFRDVEVQLTGDLNIENDATDGDILLRSDDGSGGITNYLQVDGGGVLTRAYKNFRAQDAVRLQLFCGSHPDT